jgi:hypothetical protein
MKPFCYHPFDLRQLVSFAEIARTGSFRQAAKVLHIADRVARGLKIFRQRRSGPTPPIHRPSGAQSPLAWRHKYASLRPFCRGEAPDRTRPTQKTLKVNS